MPKKLNVFQACYQLLSPFVQLEIVRKLFITADDMDKQQKWAFPGMSTRHGRQQAADLFKSRDLHCHLKAQSIHGMPTNRHNTLNKNML